MGPTLYVCLYAAANAMLFVHQLADITTLREGDSMRGAERSKPGAQCIHVTLVYCTERTDADVSVCMHVIYDYLIHAMDALEGAPRRATCGTACRCQGPTK
jgi:hypothetical protein